ncbi:MULTISPECIES: acyl-CoA dehydrogenase family protein [Metallosphaera]|uniref:Acyl-CoA dehydrogenase domain protein n=3 Tax=Metallosphaera TaxID=41980 RepID=A4YDS5_METS5|nr:MULTISPECIES: acyl-CoA dehydrogenase family protein [Metallosphaera]ABP94577.1 acyl-CoA dehydrogenase domain protein [Metallosphaera sedula DSM 5348]AIM26564.1 acyl-CoA dehydrogenase domain protein [Metallosphaera sedula]AKV73549.1 acyl-CoA dehydrogenase [Metallosphaera sedula]AKV75791.1 acyl-CoA dehydrogenase [Metallosphaera sedula]AKV78039.1 acyl-CoA dehydrogenase [Metallosphaera sedula]
MFPFENLQDFEIKISEDHELFRRTVREFAEKELLPNVQRIERENSIPDEIYQKAREMGLMGVGIPEAYGGQGGDMMMTTIANEELSRVSPAFMVRIGANHLFTTPVLIFGTEEQKKKYIPPVARGEVFAAHANTEPGAGSDVAGIKTTARKEGNKWILNGRKYFITGSDKASFLVVSARTSPPPSKKERWKGLTFFIVERDWPGVKIGSKINVMGLRGEQPNEVILDNVEVPEENVLGKVDEGFKVAVTTYDRGRVGVAAQAVGIAQGAFERAFNYSLQRQAFERPLISFEGIAFKLSDMLAHLESARLLTYWAATLAEKNHNLAVTAASLAKMIATEVAEQVSSLAIKIHGGAGVEVQTGVERYLRDAMITTIYEGANDIQRLMVARDLVRKLVGIDIQLS